MKGLDCCFEPIFGFHFLEDSFGCGGCFGVKENLNCRLKKIMWDQLPWLLCFPRMIGWTVVSNLNFETLGMIHTLQRK